MADFEEGTFKISGVDITPYVNEYLSIAQQECPEVDELNLVAEELADKADTMMVEAHEKISMAYAVYEEGKSRDLALADAHKSIARVYKLRIQAAAKRGEARAAKQDHIDQVKEAKVAFGRKMAATMNASYLSASDGAIPFAVPVGEKPKH